MKNLSFILCFLMLGFYASAQSTAESVKAIFDTKCVSCHTGTTPAGGLSLDGSLSEIYANLYMGDANLGSDKYVYPGRVDKSLLFKKINGDLEPLVHLDDNQGGIMPPANAGIALTDIEKELIRQWIQYGAPETGVVVDEALIADYYNNNGIPSFPEGTAPPAPDPSEGFQIKMGPFFVPAGEEIEYYQKYELDLPADVEVTRMETVISNYSHHFLLYAFDDNETATANVTHGLRQETSHDNIRLVNAVAEASDMQLPGGTAFFWRNNEILELNPHYINYSPTNTYGAEVYLNIYTQESGTASQEMESALIPNYDFYVPNDGNEHTFTSEFLLEIPFDIYLWQIGGHTHQYGTAFKIYQRELNGDQGEIMYDGACPQGIPGCMSPYYDYQHTPARRWDEFYTFRLNKGAIFEASYVNDGPTPVQWGATSADEMMLMLVMYVRSLDGVEITSSSEAVDRPMEVINISPNPLTEVSYIDIPEHLGKTQVRLYNLLGQELRSYTAQGGEQLAIKKANLAKGLYVISMEGNDGISRTGKITVQ